MYNSGYVTVKFNLERVCGEAVLLLYSLENMVKKAYFVATAPLRGFEKLVTGKNPVFVVNAVMRICGVCHTAHGIASIEAFEDAMGLSPPMNGRIVREAIGLVNRVQSHLLHTILLLPDIVSRDKLAKTTIEAVNLFNTINNVMGDLGGSPTHPPRLIIGGVSKLPDEKTVSSTISTLEKFIDGFLGFRDELMKYAEDSVKARFLMEKKYRPKMLASHLFYGDKYNIDLGKVREVYYTKYRSEDDMPEEAKNNSTMIALYGGQKVEVGPRARLYVFKGFSGNTLWDLQVARFIEVELCIKRIIELLEKIEFREPSSTRILTYRAGKGVGVYEAPRGLLVHRVVLDDNGRVKEYDIIVPTMFNIPHIEKASTGTPTKYAELVPRIYDPCIPCSVHVVNIKGGSNE